MLADYFNNPLMPMSYSGVSEKWYEVARSREKRLFKKLDVFVYLSVTHDNVFDLLYVSFDEINRKLTRCYHGKFVVKSKNNYLIIRQGLCVRRFLIAAIDEKVSMVVLSNKRKSKIWILSKMIPYDRTVFEKLMKSVEEQGFDIEKIELLYD